MRSHSPLTSSGVAPRASPNTCGWRRISFSVIASTTSPKSNAPCSCAMRAWNTTWSRRSPSSSRRSCEIAARDRVGHLVGLFERVGRDGREVLLEIPRAAGAGRAQRRHDLDQPGDVAGGFQAGPRMARTLAEAPATDRAESPRDRHTWAQSTSHRSRIWRSRGASQNFERLWTIEISEQYQAEANAKAGPLPNSDVIAVMPALLRDVVAQYTSQVRPRI